MFSDSKSLLSSACFPLSLEIPEVKGKINQGDELKMDITKLIAENTRTNEIFRGREVP